MEPRRLLPYLLALTVSAVIATTALVVATDRPPRPPGTPGPDRPPAVVSGATSTPRDTLATWDTHRAEAWAAGDVAALRDLYVANSRTGRADARMLAAYVDRGLRVEGLTTQVLAWRVIEESSDVLVVRVTDRIVGGVVVGEGTNAPLPRDRPTTHTVTLRRAEGVWRMAVVRDQASAAASTSRTSTSWKS